MDRSAVGESWTELGHSCVAQGTVGHGLDKVGAGFRLRHDGGRGQGRGIVGAII